MNISIPVFVCCVCMQWNKMIQDKKKVSVSTSLRTYETLAAVNDYISVECSMVTSCLRNTQRAADLLLLHTNLSF